MNKSFDIKIAIVTMVGLVIILICQRRNNTLRVLSRFVSESKNPKHCHHFAGEQQTDKKGIPVVLESYANKLLKPAGEAPPEHEMERIRNYLYTPQYRCLHSEYLGGKKDFFNDGAYDLCLEERFWPFPGNSTQKCLMYSFGVGGDLSFDNAMAQKGCEVHSFDPTEDFPDGYKSEAGVTFHKIAYGEKDVDKGTNGWKWRTMKTLMKELGHTNKYLDYLKFDTDPGLEDIAMQELLDTGMYKCVRQYSMGIHLRGPLEQPSKLNRCRLLYKQLQQLNDGGWRLYNTTDNVRGRWFNGKPNHRVLHSKNVTVNTRIQMPIEVSFVNFDVQGPCIVS